MISGFFYCFRKNEHFTFKKLLYIDNLFIAGAIGTEKHIYNKNNHLTLKSVPAKGRFVPAKGRFVPAKGYFVPANFAKFP